MSFYVTKSELLDEDMREIFISGEILLVSGRPMNIWATDKDVFYDRCPEVIDMPFLPRLVVVTFLPAVGHRHIDPIYHGEYPAVTGINPINGDEYRFGILESHNFSVRLMSDCLDE